MRRARCAVCSTQARLRPNWRHGLQDLPVETPTPLLWPNRHHPCKGAPVIQRCPGWTPLEARKTVAEPLAQRRPPRMPWSAHRRSHGASGLVPAAAAMGTAVRSQKPGTMGRRFASPMKKTRAWPEVAEKLLAADRLVERCCPGPIGLSFPVPPLPSRDCWVDRAGRRCALRAPRLPGGRRARCRHRRHRLRRRRRRRPTCHGLGGRMHASHVRGC